MEILFTVVGAVVVIGLAYMGYKTVVPKATQKAICKVVTNGKCSDGKTMRDSGSLDVLKYEGKFTINGIKPLLEAEFKDFKVDTVSFGYINDNHSKYGDATRAQSTIGMHHSHRQDNSLSATVAVTYMLGKSKKKHSASLELRMDESIETSLDRFGEEVKLLPNYKVTEAKDSIETFLTVQKYLMEASNGAGA